MSDERHQLLGQTYDAVVAHLESKGHPWQVKRMDNTPIRSSGEIYDNQVLLEVDNNIVTKLFFHDTQMIYQQGFPNAIPYAAFTSANHIAG